MTRKYTAYSSPLAKHYLDALASPDTSVRDYQDSMTKLGAMLAEKFKAAPNPVLLVSTAEDADYLTQGFSQKLAEQGIPFKFAVFWNNHYRLSDGSSVAPITQKYLQDGWKDCKTVVLLKSVISGSCVVRTNLLALLAEAGFDRIVVAAPVMLRGSETKLTGEFPIGMLSRFEFLTFAQDSQRDDDGTVRPGIGGQAHPRLGLPDQPARMQGGYLPKLVDRLAFGA